MSKSKRNSGRPESATKLARVFPDHPLRETELQFEFEGFARTLAELAWNPDNGTPFTVVVRGDWGRGKTTLLQRAQWMMDHPTDFEAPAGVRRVRTLWFNAWKYPDDDTVLAGLLGAAIDGLQKGDKLDQLKELVSSYGKGTVRSLFALAAPAQLRDLLLDGPEDRYAVVRETRAFHDTFREQFNQVSRLFFDVKAAFRDTGGLPEEELWSEEKQRREVLAIFLDDLDRCRRERVVEVLEAINLFLDLPGVCFFLGLDWQRLADVLPEAVRGDSDAFLEKIVQVAFDLPPVSAPAATAYVEGLLAGSDLEAVLKDDALPSDDLAVLAHALETRHPRHIKRFLNDLSMTLAVLRNTGKLGEGERQLPERAVVAWHLLSELLPAERWREIRALPANLSAFLREARRHEKKEIEDGEELPEEWGRIERSGVVEHHLQLLHQLTDDQRHLLIHFATPPAVEVERRRRSTGKPDLFDLDSPAWVELPGGTLPMGAQSEDPEAPGYDPEARANESPVHQVTVAPFHMARYPVTNAEYARFVEETEKQPPAHWRGGVIPEGEEAHPVVHVSWTDAVAFCEWLTRRLDEHDGRRVRLPTEAEWELTARGEEARRYPWGSAEPSETLANYGMNEGNTTPVGAFPDSATPEGIHDLAGNVLEWCADWSGAYDTEALDNSAGPKAGSSRVLRGGSFINDPRWLRASCRFGGHPEYRFVSVGFRVLWSSS